MTSVIGETMSEFAREAISAGAVQHASYDLLSEGEYRQFGIPYDLQIVEAASDGWFNLLHIHSEKMFDLLSDYPVQAVNWHTRTTPPTLREAQGRFSGGLGRWDPLVCGSPGDVKAQVKEAIAQTEGRGLILGAGCVVPITAPEVNIKAAREAVELPH